MKNKTLSLKVLKKIEFERLTKINRYTSIKQISKFDFLENEISNVITLFLLFVLFKP